MNEELKKLEELIDEKIELLKNEMMLQQQRHKIEMDTIWVALKRMKKKNEDVVLNKKTYSGTSIKRREE